MCVLFICTIACFHIFISFLYLLEGVGIPVQEAYRTEITKQCIFEQENVQIRNS